MRPHTAQSYLVEVSPSQEKSSLPMKNSLFDNWKSARERVTAYGYDDADHLVSVTDPASNLTAYGFNTENRLASLTDAPGRVTSFSYDSLGRVTAVTFPSSPS
jgi:YD repeat-containing protein